MLQHANPERCALTETSVQIFTQTAVTLVLCLLGRCPVGPLGLRRLAFERALQAAGRRRCFCGGIGMSPLAEFFFAGPQRFSRWHVAVGGLPRAVDRLAASQQPGCPKRWRTGPANLAGLGMAGLTLALA